MPKIQLRANKTRDKFAITGDKKSIMLVWEMARLFLASDEGDEDE